MTKIRYGISNQVEQNFSPSFTVNELLRDSSLLARLNAPEGVVAIAQGETLDGNDLVSNYASITLEKQASSKA